MPYLGSVVRMHDVVDVEKFVRDTLNRTIMHTLQAGEHEDAVALGLAIMCRLYERYDPAQDAASKRQRVGHVCRGARCCVPSFAGYASFVLPKKLQEEWYAMQPHFQSRKVDGRKTYVRYARAVSIEERSSQRVELHEEFSPLSVVDLETTRTPGMFTEVPMIEKGQEDNG